MKKALFTSVFALILGVSAFADNEPTVLPDNATCNEDNLGVSYGSADIEVAWEANTINTQWYSEGERLIGDDIPGTCTYGTTLVPPTPEARPGYAFGGWRLRTTSSSSNEPQVSAFDLSTLAGSTNANSYHAIAIMSTEQNDHVDGCYDNSEEYLNVSCSSSVFSDLNRYEWKAEFSGVTVYGTSGCSETAPSSNGEWLVGTPTIFISESTILNNYNSYENLTCWCRATAYTPSGGSQQAITSSPWIGYKSFMLGSMPGIGCLEDCSRECARAIYNDQDARTAMFGS